MIFLDMDKIRKEYAWKIFEKRIVIGGLGGFLRALWVRFFSISVMAIRWEK